MTQRKSFTVQEARQIGEQVGIDWDAAPFEVEQFRRGLDVELEHGLRDPSTNVTDDDPVITGKIALAHLNEFADYLLTGGTAAHRRGRRAAVSRP